METLACLPRRSWAKAGQPQKKLIARIARLNSRNIYSAAIQSNRLVIATRRGRVAAMPTDLRAIALFRRLLPNRSEPCFPARHSRALPGIEGVSFSARAATHQQPPRFQPVCSQRWEISTFGSRERENHAMIDI